MTTTTVLVPIPQCLDFDALAPKFSRTVNNLDAAATAELGRAGIDVVLREFVRLRASQLNGCAYCVDMRSKAALRTHDQPLERDRRHHPVLGTRARRCLTRDRQHRRDSQGFRTRGHGLPHRPGRPVDRDPCRDRRRKDAPVPGGMNILQAMSEEVRSLPQVPIGKLAGFARGAGNEFLLSRELVSAELAERYGLVNRALPAGELDGFVSELAGRIARLRPEVISAMKAAVNAVSARAASRRDPDSRRGAGARADRQLDLSRSLARPVVAPGTWRQAVRRVDEEVLQPDPVASRPGRERHELHGDADDGAVVLGDQRVGRRRPALDEIRAAHLAFFCAGADIADIARDRHRPRD